MDILIYVLSFVLGLIFGSFISVLVWRIKKEEKGIFFGRSKCPNCGHTLSSFDLVPIFSYLFLWWKCRYCKTKISVIYPILEFVTGLVFVFITHFLVQNYWIQIVFDYWYILIYAWLIWVFVVAISFYDILFYEISFILAGIFGILVFLPQVFWIIWNWKLALILWVVWFLAFVSIIYLRWKLRRIEWMGWWDAIWAFLIWLVFPIVLQISGLDIYPVWVSFYIAILLWFISAGIVWIFYVLAWKSSKFALPFLPFMFIWLILFVIFGEGLIKYVLG